MTAQGKDQLKPPPAGGDDVASVDNYYRGAHVLWVSGNNCATGEGGLGLIFGGFAAVAGRFGGLRGADQPK